MIEAGNTASEYWGRKVAEYDDFIRRVVPRYDELMDRLIDAVPTTSRRVLELGCGTGTLSLRLVQTLPDACFTFLDASPEMLATTRARVEQVAPGALDRCVFMEARFEDIDEATGRWDLVVASLSIHHMQSPEPLYRALAGVLEPGGALRMSDGVRAAAEDRHDAHMRVWETFWRQPGNLSEQEIESVLDHVRRHDHYQSLVDHFDWLRAAGFHRCDCLWRDGLFALMVADRT